MNPLLMPLVAVQGRSLRSRMVVLPPAPGPTSGVAAPETTQGTALRLAVLGDSTAAGCGADSLEEGLPGQIARDLADRTGRRVEWSVVGQYGATARRIRHRLLPRVDDGLDVAVLLAGVNDVLSRRPPAEWRADLEALVDGLGERARSVVLPAVPRFDVLPVLPRTLARYLAEQGDTLNEIAREVCAAHPRAVWVDTAAEQPGDAWFYSPDGFHPSTAGYRTWASLVARSIPDEVAPISE